MKRSELLMAICQLMKGYEPPNLDAYNRAAIRPVRKSIRHLIAFVNKEVDDFRVHYLVKYPLNEIIIICFFALIQNSETYTEIAQYGRDNIGFLRVFAPFSNGTPSHDTIRTAFEKLEHKQLSSTFFHYIQKALKKARKYYLKSETKYRHLIGDGKWLRGSGRYYNTDKQKSNIGTFNIYDAGSNVTLFQKKYTKKDSEIPIAREFISSTSLKETVVTLDALHCQRETTKLIIKKGGEYLIGLKENQSDFFHDTDKNFMTYLGEVTNDNYLKEPPEKNHNQVETREVFIIDGFNYYRHKSWKGLAKVAMVRKKTYNTVTKKESVEERYYISSLSKIEDIAYYSRAHWKIENNLHWHLDVSMGEDASLISNPNAAANFSVLRQMCLTFLKLLREALNDKTSIKSARKRMGWAPDRMMIILFSALDDDELLSKLETK